MPWIAAAAVLAIVVLGVWVGSGGPQTDEPATATGTISPAGSSAAAVPTPADQATDAVIDPESPTSSATPVGGEPWLDAASTACAAELDRQGSAGLREVAQIDQADGATSFWSGPAGWLVCEYVNPDTTPLLIEGTTRSDGFTDAGLALRSTGLDGALDAVRFVAGGKLPWEVRELSYDFPEGGTEQARFVQSVDGSGDTWWAVTRTVPADELAALSGENHSVTVNIVGGGAEAFRLPWHEATCAEQDFSCPSVR